MKITKEKAKAIGDKLNINWKKHSLEQFRKGLITEMEHKDVTKGDMVKTGKIALAHIKEVPNYYTKLKKVEGSSHGKKKACNAKKKTNKKAA